MKEHTKEGIISHIASYPPVFFLCAIVLGVILDSFWQAEILPQNLAVNFGTILLVLGPVLILWAQYSSFFFLRDKNICDVNLKEFRRGPYRFTRNPTYLGLFLLAFGFGFLSNSIFITGLSIIAFLIIHFVILRREEKILEAKYGADYLEYKKGVRCWL